MVFVLKKNEKGTTYYYLAHNVRVSGKKWKSLRKYLGKKLPSKKQLQVIKRQFLLENNILPAQRYEYLDEQKLEKVDFIVSEFQEKIKAYPKIVLEKIERDFTIKFTYDTNAIEGNSISLLETASLLNKKIVPQGKSLREIHEITNMEQALNFLKKTKADVSKRLVCRLHSITMKNIDYETAGKFRTYNVGIQGANWMPSHGKDVRKKFDELIRWYRNKRSGLHPIELAAIIHFKFIEVHPFGDGNGRIARLITNHILMRNGYPPINIKVKDTIPYVKTLQYTQNTQKFEPLCDWFLQKIGEEYAQSISEHE